MPLLSSPTGLAKAPGMVVVVERYQREVCLGLDRVGWRAGPANQTGPAGKESGSELWDLSVLRPLHS
ncbi:unnamed protein product [Boreogadus saida]